jgi:hypothetical protein
MPEEEKAVTQAREKRDTFTCRFCQLTKPLSEMAVVDRFFPAVVACRDCARKLR